MLWQKIKQSTFFIKATNWEFYPTYLANIPVVGIWLFHAIKARNLFFFSSVNPVIETGGVLGESKINILRRLPKETIPTSIFISKENLNNPEGKSSISFIKNLMTDDGIDYPIIAKPNVGERGFLVEKINTDEALLQYLTKVSFDFIIQSFVDFPLEICVLYHRMPNGGKGKVTSLCVKKKLSIEGDGVSTIEQLMEDYPRARFQLKRFQKNYPNLILQVPEKGQIVELEPIGNHSRGTTFLDGNHHIDEQLETVFDILGQQLDGIYYGRFDMLCESMEALKEGKNFKILEFNGVASEPAHIYDPAYKVLNAYKDIYKHWKIIYKISKQQKNRGIQSMTFKDAYASIVNYMSYLKKAKSKI